MSHMPSLDVVEKVEHDEVLEVEIITSNEDSSSNGAGAIFSFAFAVGGALLLMHGVDASAAVTMPTPDYTDTEAAWTIGAGITIIVGLLYKARRFLR